MKQSLRKKKGALTCRTALDLELFYGREREDALIVST